MDNFVAAVLGYVCGSIPFGLILSKAAGLGDVRKIGSGNIGATNVLRTGNKKIAALTLICDALKGTIPVLLAGNFLGPTAAIIAGLGALLGHIFPVWLKFKGGKGVATFIGILFALFWPLGIVFLGTWLGVALISKMSSPSALIASAAMPIVAWALGRNDLSLALLVFAIIIWIMHRANIGRLLAGTESKIDLAKKA
ncbi:MAG: glycerol-3-phosphate 1-O-acyltransferase PlsY [Aestuariivirga sp.]